MLICWRLGKFTSSELYAQVDPDRWIYTTVTTFLNRISTKGYLHAEIIPSGRHNQNIYTVAIPFEVAMSEKIEHFIDRTLGAEPLGVDLLLTALRKRKLLPKK